PLFRSGAGLLGDLTEPLGALRDRGDRDRPPALLDLGDPLVDQLFLDRLAVDRLDDLRRLFLAGGHDAVEELVGVRVAGEDALEVEDGEAAQAPHLDGEPRPDDAVHRGGDDRDLEAPPGQFPGDVDLVRVDRQRSGNEGDVIEPVRGPGLASTPDPHAHSWNSPSFRHGLRSGHPLYVGSFRRSYTIFRTTIPAVPGRVNPRARRGGAAPQGSAGPGALPDEPEPLEGEVGVHALDAPRYLGDQGGQPAGRDHRHRPVHLGAHAVDDAVDQAGVTVDDARLDIGGG